MSQNLLSQALSRSLLLSSLEPRQIEVVASRVKLQRYEQDQQILRQGIAGEEMYVLLEGEVSIFIEDRELGFEQSLLTLKPGQSFGELALLTNAPRAASARATQPSLCALLDRDTFMALLGELPEVATTVCRYLAERLAAQGMLTGVRHLRLRPQDFRPQLYLLLPAFLWERFEAVPLRAQGTMLTVATTRPEETALARILKEHLPGYEVEIVATSAEDYRQMVERAIKPLLHSQPKPRSSEPKNPLESLLAQASSLGATELCFNPQADRVYLRYCKPGWPRKLPLEDLTLDCYGEILEHLEARMTRSHGVGRGTLTLAGGSRSFVSHFLPTEHGQRLRLVWSQESHGEMKELLGSPARAQAFAQGFRYRSLTILAGPARSGRTSTMLQAATELCDPVVEDVIAVGQKGCLELAGVTVVDGQGKTMEQAIKLALEQSPDVLLLDELDSRGALLAALQAARRGCKVMAVLPAADLDGALDQLRAWSAGVFHQGLVSQVLAQRLLGRLCPHCRRRDSSAAEPSWTAPGCEQCAQTGRKGAVASFSLARFQNASLHRVEFTDFERELLSVGAISAVELIPLDGDAEVRELS